MSSHKLYKKRYQTKGITYYYDKEANVITKFIPADYLLWEQRYKDQKMFKEDLK